MNMLQKMSTTWRASPRVVMMIVLAVTALATAWWWFGTAAVLPFLFVLPCAAMMVMCMRGHGSKSDVATTQSDSGSSSTNVSS